MCNKLVIGILTYNRKKLLADTLENLVKFNNFDNIEIILLDNNSDLEYQKSNKDFAKKYGVHYVFNEIEKTDNIDINIELGHRRLIDEMLKRNSDIFCMLEDDWNNTGTIPVDDIKEFLSKNKNVGQVRLRDFRYDDTFYGGSSINFVTMKKIVFTDNAIYGDSKFKIGELHWVDSCNVMRREVLEQMNISFGMEMNRMLYFHKLYPLNAQLSPGIFYHTGPKRVREDLRKKGLFLNENLSQN